MGTGLTDQDLAAYVSGSTTPEQFKAWMNHIAKSDTCSQKVQPGRGSPGETQARRQFDDCVWHRHRSKLSVGSAFGVDKEAHDRVYGQAPTGASERIT